MKKVISILLVICVLCSTIVFANDAKNPFTDVHKGAWYYDQIVKAAELGLINGKTATEFKPDDLLTYAEAIKLAACMNELYTTGKVTLVNGSPWYKTYLDYCIEKKIITKMYHYNDNATRAGYIEIFANALPDEAFDDINNIPDGSILDVDGHASYALYVYKLYRAGIVSGVDEEHNCNPDAFIKRSEVATILCRMMDKKERVSFSTIEEEPPVVEEPIFTPEKVEEEEVIEPLEIVKNPESYEAEEYGEEIELEVSVKGGKAPYNYQWYKSGFRGAEEKLENSDYVKDVTSDALVISIEKDNTILGERVYCKVSDAEGNTVTSEKAVVFGPFSMPIDDVFSGAGSGEYETTGRVADGVVRKGDKVSVVRDGKIIAFGYVTDIQMFEKFLDAAEKGDNIGAVFEREDGVRPQSGDIMIKYKDDHELDLSDIVN